MNLRGECSLANNTYVWLKTKFGGRDHVVQTCIAFVPAKGKNVGYLYLFYYFP